MPPSEATQTFDEGSNSSDTITFKSYDATNGTLTFNLANAGQHYTLGTSDELDLDLGASGDTISLTFEYGADWDQNKATVSVTFNGTAYSPTYISPAVPTSSTSPATFSIAVNVGSVQIVWDPKIKVIAPPR